MSTFEVGMVAPGIRFSKDELVKAHPFAVGAFSALWRAGADGEYAIKCFFDDDTTGHDEFEVLSKLNDCPYTPTAYCLGTFVDDHGTVYPAIVESFVRGATLERAITGGLISGSAARPEIDAISASVIALEIARALDSIAEQGVAHGDLSPANIILTERGLTSPHPLGATPRYGIVLVDFVRERLATIPFGAPEVFGGRFYGMRNDPKRDVWSLGAIIVAMMSGDYWPEGISDLLHRACITRSDLSRIAKAKQQPLDLAALAHLQPKTEAERSLSEIVLACTMYNPRFRPSLTDIVETIESHLAATPEAAMSSMFDRLSGTEDGLTPVPPIIQRPHGTEHDPLQTPHLIS